MADTLAPKTVKMAADHTKILPNGAKMHPKSSKMKPWVPKSHFFNINQHKRKKCEVWAGVRPRFMLIYVEKIKSWAPFWTLSILKGVPKSHFFNINQHKRRTSEVREGVSKKHEILMRNQEEGVTFQDA
jgi:hypothetical protein